jgi:TusA-related sulfurtransferase
MNTIEFDLRGQICPSTLLVALKEINAHAGELGQGNEKLCFLIDNRDATVTIPEFAFNMGYAVIVGKRDGYYYIEVSRKSEQVGNVP